MDLSTEDSLRLNVMLANAVAVRIDEGTNMVYCLSGEGSEAKVQLNPNCKPDTYVRRVRELLSSNVLGSPGGYPVFLKRWTRMGQASDARLADLLMLGEPEAVVAVSGAPMLTAELAQRAWWCMPDSANARRMLQRQCVVENQIGKDLSEFLLEFLPFEQEPGDIIESVKLVLQPGLISEEQKMEIWKRGQQKNVFMVGFLHTQPESLPDPVQDRSDLEQHGPVLQELASDDNPFADFLHNLLTSKGQTFIQACKKILKRPSNQDVVVSFLEAVESYFSSVRLSPFHYDDVDSIIKDVNAYMEGNTSELKEDAALAQLRHAVPELEDDIRAMLILAHIGEPVVRQIFAKTDSVGSVMRRKIEPVSKPVSDQLNILQK
jgi:hypothetical protein